MEIFEPDLEIFQRIITAALRIFLRFSLIINNMLSKGFLTVNSGDGSVSIRPRLKTGTWLDILVQTFMFLSG